MPLEALIAGAMLVSLTFYVLLGGADYGGGIWDLLARGPCANRQRDLIASALGPVWEANHVWLILVIVVLFSAYPKAFARISTALHVPLAFLLIGIVMRGSAFTFRSYDSQEDRVQRRWGRAFAIPSLVTPVFLGVVVGALSSGEIVGVDNEMAISYFFLWVGVFPFAVGVFALVLFAFLAAVYLTLETRDPELQDDFRGKAIVAEFAAGALALAVFWLSKDGAPDVYRRLTESWWTWPLQGATAVLALGTLWSLWIRHFRIARLAAAMQVTAILWGWGLSQYPYLVRPDLTIHNSAAPEVTLRLLVYALTAGAALLFPSYWYLFRVFKAKPQ